MAAPEPNHHHDPNVARLVEAFANDDQASFYLLVVNTRVLYALSQVEDLWQRVDDEGEVQSIVYTHFLKRWPRIRAGALASAGGVAGYLIESIRNALRDALRKKERRAKRERSLIRRLDNRGNEAEAVADTGGSALDWAIVNEQMRAIENVSADPELARFGAVFKLKMLMRRPLDELERFTLNPDEAAWMADEDEDHPHPREAGRVAAWLVRLRRSDPAAQRFKPTSKVIVRMLGMVRSSTDPAIVKEKANVFDQWFRRAKVKLGKNQQD